MLKKMLSIGMLLIFVFGCNVCTIKKGLEVKWIEDNTPPHPTRWAELLLNGKIISKYIEVKGEPPYCISPDKKFLLYESFNFGIYYEVYDMIESKKYSFPEMRSWYNDIKINAKKEIFKIIWQKDTVEISNWEYVFTLYIRDRLMEKKLIFNKNADKSYDRKPSYDEFSEYLLITLKQFYNVLLPEDLEKWKIVVEPYIEMYLNGKFTKIADEMAEMEKIGKLCFFLIESLKEKYKDKIAFQIFERAFNGNFYNKDDKIVLKEDFGW